MTMNDARISTAEERRKTVRDRQSEMIEKVAVLNQKAATLKEQLYELGGTLPQRPTDRADQTVSLPAEPGCILDQVEGQLHQMEYDLCTQDELLDSCKEALGVALNKL